MTISAHPYFSPKSWERDATLTSFTADLSEPWKFSLARCVEFMKEGICKDISFRFWLWEEKWRADMLPALERFIFKRQFRQNIMIYGTSGYCAWLSNSMLLCVVWRHFFDDMIWAPLKSATNSLGLWIQCSAGSAEPCFFFLEILDW